MLWEGDPSLPGASDDLTSKRSGLARLALDKVWGEGGWAGQAVEAVLRIRQVPQVPRPPAISLGCNVGHEAAFDDFRVAYAGRE